MFRKIINYIRSKLNILLFLGSSDILPGPLSREEENEYVLRSMEGDMNARNILIEHNLRLVVFLAKKYDNTNTDLEDLVSIGTIGLIKGVNTYRLDKNIKLASYASRCIDNELLLSDILGTDADIVTKCLDQELDRNIMRREIERLNKRDREIIELRYGLNGHEEMTQKDVAEKLGISQSYISRIEKKVIKRLQSIIRV